MSRRAFWVVLSLITLSSLGLRAAIPPLLLFGSVHDDELMVRLATQIVSGNWLGNYSALGHLTLAKPAGYPLFLALASFLPWDPTVSAHMVLLGAALLLLREIRLLGVGRRAVLFFYGAVSFYPLWFGDPISRIYRESVLVPLTFLVIAFGFRLGRLVSTYMSDQSVSLKRFKFCVAVGTVALGLALSATIVVKPGWIPMFIAGFGPLIFAGLAARRSVNVLRITALSLLAASFIAMAGPLLVAALNSHYYGVRSVDTFAHGSFSDALSALSTISVTHRRYIIISSEARAIAYSVSEDAQKLAPFLEYAEGTGWRSQSCVHAGICDESMAWFTWELRDAVELAGLGDTAFEFDATLRAVAVDVQAACDSGRIECRSRGSLAPGLPPLDRIPRRELFDALALGISMMRDLPVGAMQRGTTSPTDEQVELWARFVHLEPNSGPFSEHAQASLRRSARNLGSVVNLMRDVYSAFFWAAIVVAVVGAGIHHPPGLKRSHELRLLQWSFSASALAFATFTGQLALLEAGAGLYLSLGGNLYLLPAHALLVCMILFGWARLALVLQGFAGRIQKDIHATWSSPLRADS